MIDPNGAPEGYVAVAAEESGLCTGCVFIEEVDCSFRNCVGFERKDDQNVIFKEKKHDFKELAKGVEDTPNYKAEKHFLAVGEIVADLAQDCDKYREALEDIKAILDKVLNNEKD